jgi:Chlorophyllase enzyme
VSGGEVAGVIAGRLVRVSGAGAALFLVAGSVALFARPAPAVPHRPGPPPVALSTTSVPSTTTTVEVTTTVAATTVPPTTARPAATVPTTAPAPPAVPAHRAVGVITLSFVDTSRPTPAAGSDPGERSRTLPTTVRYPADGAATASEAPGVAPSHLGGPFPLIVFAPGYDSSPAVYAALLHAWASAGYVVAAPAFPRATSGGPLDENDLDQQPADLSFVISRLLAPGSLAAVISPARIGVAGHSDGAVAALGAGYNTCCRDPRIDADVVMAGDEHAFPVGSYFPLGCPPLLIVQADNDVFNPPSFGHQVFADAHSPKYLLSLVNATHLESVTTDQAHLVVVEAATTAFFDRYLKARPDGAVRIRQAAVPGLAAVAAG